jgi:hypothetical protein
MVAENSFTDYYLAGNQLLEIERGLRQ